MDQLCPQARNHIQYHGYPMPNGRIWICMVISDSMLQNICPAGAHQGHLWHHYGQLRDHATLNISTPRAKTVPSLILWALPRGSDLAVLWQRVWIQNNLEKEKARFKLNRIEQNREKEKIEPCNCNKSWQFQARKEWMGEEDGNMTKLPNPSESPLLIW